MSADIQERDLMRSRCCTVRTVNCSQRVLMRSRCCTVHSTFNEFSWDHVVVLFTVHSRVLMRSRCLCLRTVNKSSHEITLLYCSQYIQEFSWDHVVVLFNSTFNEFSWDHVVVLFEQYIQRVLMRSLVVLFAVHSRVLWDHVVYCSQTFKSSMRSRCLLFPVHSRVLMRSRCCTVRSTFKSSHEITLLYCSNSTYNEFS